MLRNFRRILRAIAAADPFVKPSIPQAPAYATARGEATGVVHGIDSVRRELMALVRGVAMRFYVPLDCLILLNNERVKLRMLQPMDRVRILYSGDLQPYTAHSITVPLALSELHGDETSACGLGFSARTPPDRAGDAATP